jgi:hypothetical protein
MTDMGRTDTGTRPHDGLRRAVERCGYYPELVVESVDLALAGEQVMSYLVHHEATFDHDELRRHLTVLVLTPTRLVVGHTDEHPADPTLPRPHATTSTESVRLARIGSVVVTRVVDEPATYQPGTLAREIVLTIGWGAISRLDLEPATCGDPECEADHGFTGSTTIDDFSVRMSVAADGEEGMAEALDFARALSRATAAH